MKIELKEDQKVKVSDPKKVSDVLFSILSTESELDRGKEHIWVIGVDTKNRIKYIELVGLGGLDSLYVEPRQIFRTAIYYNVYAIIMGHNHPSGECNPSKQDDILTEKMKEGADFLKISLLDSVIINDKSNAYYSYQEDGKL